MRRQRSWDEPVPVYETREPLGKRLGRFAVLMGAIFVISAAVVVTQRLSRDSLALLIGLSCGVAAMLPTLALGVLVWRREDARARAREETQAQRQLGQSYGSPPVIVVTPQGIPGASYGQYPALGASGQSGSWMPSSSGRDFKIVGGSD